MYSPPKKAFYSVEINYSQASCKILELGRDSGAKRLFQHTKRDARSGVSFAYMGDIAETQGQSNETCLRGHIWNKETISGIVMMQSSMVTVLIRLA